MTERYQGYIPTVSGRTTIYNNPARSSVPTSVGYGSLYAGDMHVVPSASHSHHITPRGYSTSTNAAGVSTTTRTYAVISDSRAAPKARDTGRPRRSTLDSSSRPPVIITTTQLERPHVSSSSSHASSGRSGSPIRDDYRASDSQVYSLPASSIRSRSSTRPYIAVTSEANSGRHRERGERHLSPHDLVEAYRSSRPSVTYPSDPRHSTAAIDYGDEGYQYTNAGELVKYDLDHSNSGRSSRRQASMDAGYYRPNVNYDADRRNFNVNTSHDLNRPPIGPSRPADGRGGPPPSTRGFDKINRAYDVRDAPHVVPALPPTISTVAQLERPESASASNRRPRPLSLHQEGGLRPSYHDEYYRSREDECHMRDMRDRGRDRDHEGRPETSRYLDDGVVSRGFGIRTHLRATSLEARDRRRDARLDEPRKRSDEDLCYGNDKNRDSRRRNQLSLSHADDHRGSRHDGRVGSEEFQDRSERSRVRDSLTTGLGAVATAMGLMPSVFKSQDKRAQEPPLPPRRRSPPEERDIRKEVRKDVPRVQEWTQEPLLPHERSREPAREKELIRDKQPLMIREADPTQERDPLRQIFREKEPAREREYVREREPAMEDGRMIIEPARRPFRDAQSGGQTERQSGYESDDTKRRRRNRDSNMFDPNDASDLKQLKEQFASMDVADRRKEQDTGRSAATEKTRARSRSASRDRASHGPSKNLSREELVDEPRGRELVSPASEGKQVRVVSPPREKSDGKPLRGILKQPKASFPEEDNPVREGVAPHKEDKKLKEVPPGARWTKINRKIVNPEALTIGKERFEARDDFVIVLRVLSKEEIQAYAAATQVLRGKHIESLVDRDERNRSVANLTVLTDGRLERRRNKHDGDWERDDDGRRDREREADRDRSVDDNGQEAERHRQHRRSRDSEEGDDDDRHGQHSSRPFKERERELEGKGAGNS
ncbi:hypothetical protein E4U41_004963 [Claviceps citrina]|nr:hypothetical protein E4U41_004963 [Claviceps citrina]